MIDYFIINIDIICHIYFLIFHTLSVFTLTSEELDKFQKSDEISANILKYISQIFHFGFILVFTFSNGLMCSKYFSKNGKNFWREYWNFVRRKYTRFAKFYYLFIFLYNILVNFIIKDEAKNKNLNKICIETIPYKILFLSNFHQEYVR